MTEPFPSMEIFSPDDDSTLVHLVEYLEEFQRRREALIRVKILTIKIKIKKNSILWYLKRFRSDIGVRIVVKAFKY